MNDMRRENQTLLLNAALDGELDAAGMIEIEAKLAADPALAAEYGRLVALREAIRARAPRESAPESLRARVMAMAQTPGQARPTAPRRARPWDAPYRALAASLLLGILLGAGAVERFAAPTRRRSSAPSSPASSGAVFRASRSTSRLRIGIRSSRGWPARSPARRPWSI